MQGMQALIDEYIEYWGLKRPPFHLAPDSTMVYTGGQYYECLERLKYAVHTGKGGVLLVSEDAGLGKTTILLKLIDDMKARYGEAFRYAFIEYPSLTSGQIMAYITSSLIDSKNRDDHGSRRLTSGLISNRHHMAHDLKYCNDKLKNITIIKETLTEAKREGGKSVIIVDEAQMLCGARDILQELRALINLQYGNEYLHTFILSGQKPLWNEIQAIPEFWQRLPVRYYFSPITLEETKGLIGFRLHKAGLDSGKEIFTADALTLIHRHSKGAPRTIMALSDLSLLVGYNDRSNKIGYKEVTKAINAMSGKGDTLPYIEGSGLESKGLMPSSGSIRVGFREGTRNETAKEKAVIKGSTGLSWSTSIKPLYAFIAILFALFLCAASGYFYGKKVELEDKGTAVYEKTMVLSSQAPSIKRGIEREGLYREAIIKVDRANIREGPGIDKKIIGHIAKGERIHLIEETLDKKGIRWYGFWFYMERKGWVSEKVLMLSK